MGKNAPSQRSAGGLRKAITNYELRITNCRLLIFLAALFAFCFFTSNSFGQIILPADLDSLAQKINSGTDEQKRDALFQLRNFKTAEASRVALPALRDSSEIVRATATASVIFLPPDEAAQNLLPLLNDKKELVRRETAFALGKIRNPLVIQLLIQTFQKEKTGEVKNACVIALGEIGEVSAINFLTQILQKPAKKDDDADEFLRRSAARSIGQIAQFRQTGNSEVLTPQNLLINGAASQKIISPLYKNLANDSADFRVAVPILIKILQAPNESDDTKREAAFALGAIADSSAVPVLRSNLTAPDYYLVRICEEAIAKILSSNPLPNQLSQ